MSDSDDLLAIPEASPRFQLVESLIPDLYAHAAGLRGAADACTDTQAALRTRLSQAAELMERAASELGTDPSVPMFLRNQA